MNGDTSDDHDQHPEQPSISASDLGRGAAKLSVGDDEVAFRDEEQARRAAINLLHVVGGRSVLLDAYNTGRRRAEEYGPPDDNFEMIGDLWSDYSDGDESGFDYAMMMILAKVARMSTGEVSRDGLVDIAGYARAAAVYCNINDTKTRDP